jgi:hypothetical protein
MTMEGKDLRHLERTARRQGERTETDLNIEEGVVDPHFDGAVTGTPRRWLRLEAAVVVVAALVAFSTLHQSWWLVPAGILLPDVMMAGYLAGTRIGAATYNLAHATLLPVSLVGLGWSQHTPLVAAIGLIWLAHVGLDRLMGYGLKYHDHFQRTHLGVIGRGYPVANRRVIGED